MPVDYRPGSAELSQREAFRRSRLARWYRATLDRELLGWIARARPRALLDVGAGEGILLEKERARRGASTAGEPGLVRLALDLHRENARICRALGFPAVHADAVALPFPAGAFDLVLLTNMLEHVEDPGAALREARRVLVPGGLALVLVPHEDNFRRARILLGRRKEAALDYGHVHSWTPCSLAGALEEAGFTREASRNLPLPRWATALHHLAAGRAGSPKTRVTPTGLKACGALILNGLA